MFENLTERLNQAVREMRGHARINAEILDESLRTVRTALLEADVALPVVRDFIEQVRARSLDREVSASLTPGQMVVRIVQEELVRAMGGPGAALTLNVEPPAIILLAGLQGAGKTTTAVKLALWLTREKRKKVMLSSCDVYRPAAMEQLAVLARANALEYIEPPAGGQPRDIAAHALARARTGFADVLIVDTAGRLHVDAGMMQEVRELSGLLQPTDTLFVVDSMLGQDAVKSAAAFAEHLRLSGIVLSKTDGDARGGAALSARHVTGAPILFMGTGEKVEDFSEFLPDRVASRILGMGDVLGFIEEVERKADRGKAEALARKVRKGQGFDLDDLQQQLRQMRDMGGLAGLMSKLPGEMQMHAAAAPGTDEKQLKRMDAIINSMTPGERRRPEIINGSRKRRIAAGSGTAIQDVNRLLKQHQVMQKMMKRMARPGGIKGLVRGLGGRMPPGFPR